MGRADRWMRRLFVAALLVAMAASSSWIAAPLAVRGWHTVARAFTALVAPEPAGTGSAPGTGSPTAAGSAAGDAANGADAAPGAAIGPGASGDQGLASGTLSADGYAWPLSGAKITTYFAPNAAGTMLLEGVPIHNGVDLALPCATPIGAAHSGRVIYSGRRADPYLGFSSSVQPYYDELIRRKLTDRALPIMVVIDDGDGLIAAYVHLGEADVLPGEAVRVGETIGLEGRTGNATGCHLHFSLFLADGPWVPVAPTLVEKWHYPAFMRLRVDPLLFLPPDSPDAGYPATGLTPPADPPRYETPPDSVPGLPLD